VHTPRSEGYRMPAEWEKHQATWVSWPKNPDTFPAPILPKVEAAYARLVESLSAGEEVRVLVDDERAESRARSKLKRGGEVSFVRLKTADVWVRDYAPTCVRGRDVALVKWRFNAWGGKYEDLLPDDEAGRRLAALTGLRTFEPGVVLEGGSIDVNGGGTLLTTEQCLLNPNRNPGMRRDEVERVLRGFLGAENVVWLAGGIEGDDTDGHVDDVARFVDGRTVLVASEEREGDPNHAVLEEDIAALERAEDERGRSLEVLRVPMPPRVEAEGGRLPASHLNFYVGNCAVVVPIFGGESDRAALRAIEGAFPTREVVGIDCRALVYGLGTLHCVTQQVPAA
jgi:agmatine deiminase